ncbi:MAG: LysR family transcriptional regulator [Erysipelotrichaceae bacterium]|nr:LysR family transcriptional regulator [Erysipelotrichaceae bacterium]
MNVHDIHNFMVVVDSGSFTKAARKLFMTPQGLSKSIKSLEEELGAELLSRSSKGVSLTENGRIFMESAQILYDQLMTMQHLFTKETDKKEGKLTVIVPPYTLEPERQDYLLDYSKYHPAVRIEISEKNDLLIDQDVEDGKADIGITLLPVNTELMNVYPVRAINYCALVYEGHPLYSKGEISFQDLKNEKIIIENQDSKVNHLFKKICADYGFKPNISYEASDHNKIQWMVHKEMGIGIVLQDYPGRALYNNTQEIRFHEGFVCERVLITRKPESIAVGVFLDYLRNGRVLVG